MTTTNKPRWVRAALKVFASLFTILTMAFAWFLMATRAKNDAEALGIAFVAALICAFVWDHVV